jgi:hypothetical protein
MLARHVSDLIGPSSGAFCTSCIRRLWYVVIRVLLDTSSRMCVHKDLTVLYVLVLWVSQVTYDGNELHSFGCL